MPQLTAQTTEYTFSINEMKGMICRELKVPEEAITVNYHQSDISNQYLDNYPNYVVTEVKVTVDHTKI
jgi:hypothetical protein